MNGNILKCYQKKTKVLRRGNKHMQNRRFYNNNNNNNNNKTTIYKAQ